MEMHQVRYFVAVSRTLNFTRGADECNVTQPSLTRAIKQLEAELGGDLFRRERPAAQLTELGQRMHPLLKQCYEAAVGARSLALSFKGGKVGTLRMEAHMQVKLCARCPYTPDDLATHYEPKAALHLCAKCDNEEEEKRRKKCSTARLTFGVAKQSAARSVTESLVSSDTTLGELPFVQRSAWIASRPAGRATANGYADFKPPEDSRSEDHVELSCCPGLRNKEHAR
jgi:Bacterial regulatory helix-turn-helix protein, lysR family